MNTDELRQVHQPLKDRYEADPSTALITLHASGSPCIDARRGSEVPDEGHQEHRDDSKQHD